MKSQLDRITVIPGVCNGKPTIRGLRLTVHTLLSHLAAGESEQEIFEEFPFLEKGDITAALEYSAIMAEYVSIPLRRTEEVIAREVIELAPNTKRKTKVSK